MYNPSSTVQIRNIMDLPQVDCENAKALRLVFTSDGVIVVIRSIERYDLVKIKLTESEAEH